MNDSIMNGMRIGIVVILTALIWISCGNNNDSDTDMEEPDPAATGTAVWDHLQQENYQETWQLWPGTKELYEGTDPHGARLTIYLNDIAHDAVTDGRTPLPNGAIIVKENYMPDSTLAAITTMYKVEGYNPEHNDWFWLKNDPAGVIEVEGRVDGCQSCHSQAPGNDYIYTE